jgi:hypothetical protein
MRPASPSPVSSETSVLSSCKPSPSDMLVGVTSPFLSVYVERPVGRGVLSVEATEAAGVARELRVRLGGMSFLWVLVLVQAAVVVRVSRTLRDRVASSFRSEPCFLGRGRSARGWTAVRALIRAIVSCGAGPVELKERGVGCEKGESSRDCIE